MKDTAVSCVFEILGKRETGFSWDVMDTEFLDGGWFMYRAAKLDETKKYALIQQAKLVHADLHYMDETGTYRLWSYIRSNPITENKELKERLINAARKQKEPVIYQDENQVLFSCLYSADIDAFLLVGPMALKKMDVVELHQYYAAYSMKPDKEQEFIVFPFSRALSVIGLMNVTFTGRIIPDGELMEKNNLLHQTDGSMGKEFLEFDFRTEAEEQHHHSYRQEKKLLSCVREGRVEEALQMSMDLDIETGRLSGNDMHHWQHLVVVAITLCTRAAIEGGMAPAEAYRVSDYYIQKSENCKEVSALVAWRNSAVKDLAERVRRLNSVKHTSNYVENAQHYIAAHYREKIYLEDIAKKLSISATYLSKLFVKETEERLQDYIVRFRVERAANLLMYSEETISYIAEYVNFPSQSYMGKVFKKYKGMTPQKYRDKYKPREFETR